MTPQEEALSLADLLVGRTISRVFRHRTCEVGFEFTDGARFFASGMERAPLELSVTGSEESPRIGDA